MQLKIHSNFDISHLNTFGVKCNAKQYVAINHLNDLKTLCSSITLHEENFLILGGGSNILFTKDYDGLIIHNQLKGRALTSQDENHYYVKASGGENWHEFVLWCISNNYAGVENLSLIPGNVGASPIQNIGAYGVEIKDVFYSLEAFHIASGEIHEFSLKDCEFGYRESVFKNQFKGQYIILSVTYKLNKTPLLNTSYGAIEQELKDRCISTPSIKDISDAVIAIRSSKLPDPKVLGNTGSFFKNPIIEKSLLDQIKEKHPNIVAYPVNEKKVKIAAGWLIENAGWKGHKRSTHGVHVKQALVLVNYGDATGGEIYQLSQDIIDDVNNKFGILLEREVNVI